MPNDLFIIGTYFFQFTLMEPIVQHKFDFGGIDVVLN